MKILLISLCFSVFTSVMSKDMQNEEVALFMPENSMNISEDAIFQSDITKKEFVDIIDKVTDSFKDEIKRRHGILRVSKKWNNETVNASASRFGPFYFLNMYGGLARHPDITKDGFALVVCHEMGHHLGGATKNKMFLMRWASVEGQSDYFATLKCFRKVFKDDNNIEIVSKMEVDELAVKKCEKSWSNEEDIALCVRSIMGGISLAKLLNFGRGEAPSLETKDSRVVSKTIVMHPRAQCRLDTYVEGALCTVSIDDKLSKKNPDTGTCNRKNNDVIGIRPLCWFRPKK